MSAQVSEVHRNCLRSSLPRLESPAWQSRRDLGLQLLKTLANYYPEVFKSEGVLEKIPDMISGSSIMLGQLHCFFLPRIGFCIIASLFSWLLSCHIFPFVFVLQLMLVWRSFRSLEASTMNSRRSQSESELRS